jgi:hypothetical protein
MTQVAFAQTHPDETDLTAEPHGEISADAMLQASRRVDWRFLLPDPQLGQVAFVGRAWGTLFESLQLLSTSTVVIDLPASRTDDGSLPIYDVAVLPCPTDAALKQAVGVLRPGGWLYLEASHPVWRRQRAHACGSPLSPRACVAALRRSGMEEISVHWHWPDFESCTKIVPLDDAAVLLHVLARFRRGRRGQVITALARRLLRSGLLAQIAPSVSVVARRSQPQVDTVQPSGGTDDPPQGQGR